MVLSMLSMFLRDRTQHSRGFSSIEVLLASSIFILLMTSLTGAYFYGREATTLASKRAQATLLAEEGLEVVRNIRDKDFGILNDGTHGLRLAGNNRWVFSNNANETDGFTREIVIDAVDPKRKDVTANVTWEQNPQRTGLVSLMTRLTNWTEADPPPAAPTNLVATAGNALVNLSWTANTEPDLAGYRILRSNTSGGPFNEIAGPQTQTTYTNNGLTNGTAYYYVVQAQDDAGSLSANSNQVTATPSAPGNGKIICTELYAQGLLSEEIFKADQAYGAKIAKERPLLMRGYHVWAAPMVASMKSSPVVTHLVLVLAKPWSQQMAYEMGAVEHGSVFGKILMLIGEPITEAVGIVHYGIEYVKYVFER